MSTLPYAREEGYSQDFRHDFSQLINGIASRLSSDENLRNRMMTEVRALAIFLVFAAKNSIPFGGIEAVQNILSGIEKHLDGITDPVALNSESYSELRQLYMEMAQAICVIRISEADNKLREARQDAR